MRTPFDTSKTSNRKEVTPRQYLQDFKKSWRHNVPVDIHNPNFKTKTKVRKNLKFQKIVGRQHSIDTHKTKFLRKKQRGDIQSILAPKSARKRHSIDTRNRMSKEATFHRYLQYHSAGRRLLVDTCIFENQKPGFHAKTRLSRQNPAFMPKTWLSCQKPKSGFHANKTKTWLSCQK